MKESILKAFNDRKTHKNIDSKVVNTLNKLDKLITEYICYNLSNTEYDTLVTFNCNLSYLIIDCPYGGEIKLNISEYACSFIDKLEDFLVYYCENNNLKFESYGKYNSFMDSQNRKKFWISERGEEDDK